MKKNHEIRVKVSDEELERIEKKAEKLGMPVSTFLRVLGLTATITPT
jgi:predicted DNA binding CopG/RHH family protein